MLVKGPHGNNQFRIRHAALFSADSIVWWISPQRPPGHVAYITAPTLENWMHHRALDVIWWNRRRYIYFSITPHTTRSSAKSLTSTASRQCWQMAKMHLYFSCFLQLTQHISGPFYWHGLTSIPAWISDCMQKKVWDEITYLLPNFNGASVV